MIRDKSAADRQTVLVQIDTITRLRISQTLRCCLIILNQGRLFFDIRDENNTMDTKSRTQDEWIALRCQSGEPDAFEDLVAVMERPLLYYATKLTGNAETALDVLQDAWVSVFRGIRRLKDPGSLRPWLYRITHGIAVDRIRRNISIERAGEVHVAAFHESADPSFSESERTKASPATGARTPRICRQRRRPEIEPTMNQQPGRIPREPVVQSGNQMQIWGGLWVTLLLWKRIWLCHTLVTGA
jgi:RNA polymerase sigma factor (sigma-70 family)